MKSKAKQEHAFLSPKIIVAPNGSLMRAMHIVSVSPLFESTDLGTDAFAVYTVGSEEPFLFAAPLKGDGAKAEANRKKHTASLYHDFVARWTAVLEGSSFSKN
jgi:hypothetical protein